jgi:cyclic pyranopterin phosphate synthase
MRGVNDDEVCDLARLTLEKDWQVRFIEVMPMRQNPGAQESMYVSAAEIRTRLESEFGKLEAVERGELAGPASEFRLPGGRGKIGFITPLSHTFCEACNRVRLTPTGKLRLCLFGEAGVDLREPVRSGATVGDLVGIIRDSLARKPESHDLALGYSGPEAPVTMSQIGG